MKAYIKAPRLYVEDDLTEGCEVPLSQDQAHYLLNVMRKNNGDFLRIFNGINGEFIAKLRLLTKKKIVALIDKKIRDHSVQKRTIRLYFPLIKKDRLGFMIEKAVELGVTDFYPIITERTQSQKINKNKMQKQIIEALEQCERLHVPSLHPLQKLTEIDFEETVFAAIERSDMPLFSGAVEGDVSVLIGPEGGWSDAEINFLKTCPSITPVSLGEAILRAETAALFMLSRIG